MALGARALGLLDLPLTPVLMVVTPRTEAILIFKQFNN